MPRFAANLSMLFREVPMLERFAAAKAAGFGAVEILFPYDSPAPALREAMTAADLELCLINCPPPNYTGGARGFAAVPEAQARFRHDFKRVLRYAKLLKPEHIHIMAGVAEPGRAQDQCFIDNLRWAAAEAPAQSLTIEPINTRDLPGYYLRDFEQAGELLDAVGAANVNLQFDAYHAHKITGNTLATWKKFGHRAVHVQIAGAEGRHEPLAGAIDYPGFFATLDSDGYKGLVSAEYIPADGTEEGLSWLREML